MTATYVPTAEALTPGNFLTTFNAEVSAVRETKTRYYVTLVKSDDSVVERYIEKVQSVVMVGRI